MHFGVKSLDIEFQFEQSDQDFMNAMYIYIRISIRSQSIHELDNRQTLADTSHVNIPDGTCGACVAQR